MSEEAPRSSMATVVSAIAVILLVAGYFSAWAYTAAFADLTARRMSPAPFVIVERVSGTAQAMQGTRVIELPFHYTSISLWCGDAEIEILSHTESR